MSSFRASPSAKTKRNKFEGLSHNFKQTSRKLEKTKHIPHLQALNLINPQFYTDLETLLEFNKIQVR